MRSDLGDEFRLKHILDAIDEVETYIKDVNFSDFINNSMIRFACIKQLEIIGEAANHISESLKAKFAVIEWAQIVGMRNIFVHEYFGIDSSLVWEIIKNDMVNLKVRIRMVMETDFPNRAD